MKFPGDQDSGKQAMRLQGREGVKGRRAGRQGGRGSAAEKTRHLGGSSSCGRPPGRPSPPGTVLGAPPPTREVGLGGAHAQRQQPPIRAWTTLGASLLDVMCL